MTDPTASHDEAAEQIVLGALLMARGDVEFGQVVELVTSESFYRPAHRTLFQEIIAAYAAGLPTDPVGIAAGMPGATLNQIGGAPYLHTLVSAVPSVSQAPHFARIVAGHQRRRRHGELSVRVRELADVEGDRLTERTVAILEDLADLAGLPSAAPGPVTLGPVPAYPSKVLVGTPLGDLVRDSGGLPDAFFGGAGLGAAASIVPTAEVEIGDAMTEVPALWIPLLGPRGAGKTPAMSLAFQDIRRAEVQAHELYSGEFELWQSLPRKDRDPNPPRDWTYLVTDLTMEMLARRLRAAGGAASVVVDELVLFLGAMGEYKNGAGGDRGRVLSLWSGQSWRYQRVSSGLDLLIPRPVVSVVGGLQPPVHHRLGGEEDGMRPRWLPHIATLDAVAQERGGMAKLPESWTEMVNRLYGNRQPRTWELEGGPHRAWLAARKRWKYAAGGNETASTSAALVKADVQAARVALVLAETVEPGKGGPLPPEAMTAAIAIVDFVMDCWRSLPEQAGPGLSRRAEVQDARVEKLRAWLADRAEGEATKADILRAQVAGIKVKDELDQLLERYVATYPGTVSTRRGGTKGGRPATVVRPPGGNRA